MAKNRQLPVAFEKVLMCPKIQKPSQLRTRSAPKLLLLEEDALKKWRNQQDTKTGQGGEVLACLDGSCLEGRTGCYAWIGSENSVQDSEGTPQGVTKVQPISSRRYNTIHICATSIHIHEKEKNFQISYSNHFSTKILFTLVFIFKFNISEAPNQLHGKMTLEAFLGNSMLRFSSIKYSMLGWFHNHHTCSGRALLVSQRPIFSTIGSI